MPLVHSLLEFPSFDRHCERVFPHLYKYFISSSSPSPLISSLPALSFWILKVLQYNNNHLPPPSVSDRQTISSLLAPTVPAHIFPVTLTPEQLYLVRIPLSHPLSVDPCCPLERLFIREAASTICHSFWLPHSLVVSNSHNIPAGSDSFSSLFHFCPFTALCCCRYRLPSSLWEP